MTEPQRPPDRSSSDSSKCCDDHDSMIITVPCQMLVMTIRVIYVKLIFELPIRASHYRTTATYTQVLIIRYTSSDFLFLSQKEYSR